MKRGHAAPLSAHHRIAELHAAGARRGAIAHELDLCPKTVTQIAKRRGFNFLHQKGRCRCDRPMVLVSRPKAAAATGKATNGAPAVLATGAANDKETLRSARTRHRRVDSAELVRALKMIAVGMKPAVAGRACGIAKSTLYKIMVRAGLRTSGARGSQTSPVAASIANADESESPVLAAARHLSGLGWDIQRLPDGRWRIDRRLVGPRELVAEANAVGAGLHYPLIAPLVGTVRP